MERLVLRGARLFDGVGDPVAGRAVVVEDGRIASVVSDAQGAAGGGRTLDLGGLTLLPGLINCHVHLALGAEADPPRALREESPGMTVVKMITRARHTVESGVTTVRDLSGREYLELAVRDAVRLGLVPGPRILAAGRGICMTGGHGWWLGREADGPDEVRRAVREQLKAGVDVIKILASGGVLTPGVDPKSPQLELDEIRAAVQEARKAGRRTAAHAIAEKAIEHCIEAGITSVEHGIYLTEALAERMARDGVVLVATLSAPHAISSGGLGAGIPEFMVRKSDAVRDQHGEAFQIALRHGVTIAAGNDAGTPLNSHASLVPELALMVKAGMAPLDVVRAATAVAARTLGLEHETGRIAPGLAADLLAVGGNPAERIEALGDVRLVIAGGRIVVSRLAGERRRAEAPR
ncbi:MAG: amidohydrolase family protein [Candidatus Rokubacteria bacterium]|nr:amidohydrolase family protein [Candidatus Rokubacteria bacterium]MBI3826679.1 amidohydrolase family protein [Candidatus Rokubacteria bacterium]